MPGCSHSTRPRYTGDLDILVARGDENADKLMAVIGAFGFGHAGIKREISCRSITSPTWAREPNLIDILTGISGVSFDEAWANREPGKIADTAVFVISRDLLIKNKRRLTGTKIREISSYWRELGPRVVKTVARQKVRGIEPEAIPFRWTNRIFVRFKDSGAMLSEA